MIHFEISRKRWENLLQSLLELGYGRLDHQLEITGNNDEFEGAEVVFNMMSEELKHRLMHLSFTKPATFQRYVNHYTLITGKDFMIKEVCEDFVTHYQWTPDQIKSTCFLDLIEKEASDYLVSAYGSLKEESHKIHRLTLLGDSFSFSIKKMGNSGILAINLYQLHLDTKEPPLPYEKRNRQKAKLIQTKRNEDLLEQFKEDVSKYPLNKKLDLEELYQKYPTNKNMLKKLFKQHYQCGAYELHLSLRMNYAYAQIEQTEVPFKETALDVCYANYQAFVKQFKKYYNILPTDLRNHGQRLKKDETEDY